MSSRSSRDATRRFSFRNGRWSGRGRSRLLAYAPRTFSLYLAAILVGMAGCGPSGDGSREANAAPGLRGAASTDTIPDRRLPPRGEAWVVFDGDTVRAEIAETPESREEGLKHRRNLPDGTGMLFVFDDEEVRSFWMRDTYVPLSIAFLDSGMRIVDIQQMEPETEEYHDSAAPAMFALEVPQGWFEDHGVSRGDHADIVFGPR